MYEMFTKANEVQRGVWISMLLRMVYLAITEYRYSVQTQVLYFAAPGTQVLRYVQLNPFANLEGEVIYVMVRVKVPAAGRCRCRIEPRLYKRNNAYLIGLAVSSYECTGGDECSCHRRRCTSEIAPAMLLTMQMDRLAAKC